MRARYIYFTGVALLTTAALIDSGVVAALVVSGLALVVYTVAYVIADGD